MLLLLYYTQLLIYDNACVHVVSQSEIKRLKHAYRTASHERKFMLYQQKEILRLKEDTQKIWDKLQQEKATKETKQATAASIDRSISEASSVCFYL